MTTGLLEAWFRDFTSRQGALIAWVSVLVVTLFVLVSATMATLIGHHVWTHAQRLRRRAARDQIVALIASAAAEPGQLAPAVATARRRFGVRATGAVLRELRQRVRGEVGESLTRELERIGEVARLVKQAGSRRTWRRIGAANRLGDCGGPRAAEALSRLMQDQDLDVREVAREAALLSGEAPLVEAAVESFLLDLPRLGAGRVGFYARLATVAPEQLRLLVANGRIAGPEEKLAIEALGHVRHAAAVPLAEERLSSPDPELRATVVRFLGRLESDRLRAAVRERLFDPAWFVRAAASRALETLGVGPEEERALGAALRDAAWWVRANAARTLAQHGRLELLLDAASGADAFASDVSLGALAGARDLRPAEARLRALAEQRPDDAVLQSLVQRLTREAT